MTVEILIVGTIEVEPQRRAALLEAVRPYVERTRSTSLMAVEIRRPVGWC